MDTERDAARAVRESMLDSTGMKWTHELQARQVIQIHFENNTQQNRPSTECYVSFVGIGSISWRPFRS